MIVKVYAMLWAFIAAAAGILFLTGNFTNMTAVVFGFISLGMVFMGMMGVLPATIAHPAPAKMKLEKTGPATKPAPEKNKGFVPVGQIQAH